MKSHFSKTLSALRRNTGFSQRQAASDLGISQALLSHYENDAREPKLEFVVRACDYYNVSADYLLGRNSNKTSRSLPMPHDSENAPRLISNTCDVFDKLEKLSSPELYAAVVDYLIAPIETVADILSDPNAPNDPMRDVRLKLAEATLAAFAREKLRIED